MVKHTLFIVTETRGNYAVTGLVKPHHWSFFIQTGQDQTTGIAHQLHGMPGAFYYHGSENVDLRMYKTKEEQLEIGEIDESSIEKIHDILKTLPIETSESSSWNCQNWTLAGLSLLRADGFVYDYMTNEVIKNWLREV